MARRDARQEGCRPNRAVPGRAKVWISVGHVSDAQAPAPQRDPGSAGGGRSEIAPPPRKRGRPSKADLILRAKSPAPSRQPSAVLQLLMRTMEEEKRKLELAGLLVPKS
jgi:hypothetical protein